MRLKNRLGELLAVHERKTGRKWTYDDIVRETGVSSSTISAYVQNRVRRYDEVTVIPFLKFLKCTPGEFFVLEEDAQDRGETVDTARRG